jgi:hypothetical protein
VCGGIFLRVERPAFLHEWANVAQNELIDLGMGRGSGREFVAFQRPLVIVICHENFAPCREETGEFVGVVEWLEQTKFFRL